MIIFAHSKCKRYENRKIQGVALPQKERTKGFRCACGKEDGLRGKGCQGGFAGQCQDTGHPSLLRGRAYQ